MRAREPKAARPAVNAARPAVNAARLAVDVTFAARRPWVPRRAEFDTWATAAFAMGRKRTVGTAGRRTAVQGATGPGATGRGASVLSVRVVGSAQSRRLNAQYRHKDKPTNVLSFGGFGLAGDGVDYVGELVICAPVVAREAREQQKTRTAHWAHMTVHGVLHLLGFDHELDEEAGKMAAREVQILDRLGFSDPYL
jgi:probable rRNA maturation factor